jgi:uncharacterized protein YjbI with pentapeptide repeats
LTSPDLSFADLSFVDLTRANLRETELLGANLEDAQGVTDEQLAQVQDLNGATMPNGQKYEEWRKDH